MSVYLSEEEQVEMIKAWWEKYGNGILTLVLVCMLMVLGYQWWAKNTAARQALASSAYAQVLMAANQNDAEKVEMAASKVMKEFTNTPYTALSALMLARMEVQKQQWDKALSTLQTVIDSSPIASFRQIARIRSAKILVSEGKATEAIERLSTVDDDVFLPMIAAIRGDAYLARGEKNQAKQQFETALEATPHTAGTRVLLQMKASELGVVDNHVAEQAKGEPVG